MGSLVTQTSGAFTSLQENEQINVITQNLATDSQNGTAPTPTSTGFSATGGLRWHDTATNTLWIRNQADTAWMAVRKYDETNGFASAMAGGNICSAGPGLKNPVHNGAFRIWQRGTSFSNPGYTQAYTADRWQHNTNGSGATIAVSQQPVTDAAVQNAGFAYWMNINQSVAGSGMSVNQLIHKIESVATLAGQQAVIGFWAKTSSGTATLTFQCEQVYGTGGSATTFTTLETFNLTTTPTFFQASFPVGSINGKTLGTAGTDILGLIFSLPLNAVQSIWITGVQLEPGSLSTPFDMRPVGLELALCQRFYQTGHAIFYGSALAGAAVAHSWEAPVVMRAVPTVAYNFTTHTNFSTAPSVVANGPDSFQTSAIVSSGSTPYGMTGTYTASADL